MQVKTLKKLESPDPKNHEGLTGSQLEYLNGVKKVYGAVTEAEVKAALIARQKMTEDSEVERARSVDVCVCVSMSMYVSVHIVRIQKLNEQGLLTCVDVCVCAYVYVCVCAHC